MPAAHACMLAAPGPACLLAPAGMLSMARGGDPGSGSSSFFVCYGDAPHLDMQYGIFG